MYRSLISRVLVALLLVAVIGKPCANLFSKSAEASVAIISLSAEALVDGEQTSKCKIKCITGRVEEADSAVLPPDKSVTWADRWSSGLAKTPTSIQGSLQGRFDGHKPQARQLDGLRKRLAILSRFLI